MSIVLIDTSKLALENDGNLDAINTSTAAAAAHLAAIKTDTDAAATAANQGTEISALAAILSDMGSALTNQAAMITDLAEIVTNTNRLPTLSGGASPITATALPLPTGAATAAKQPALGTAGSASSDVVTVQGIASGTAQPVSGTVTANAGTNLNTSALARESGGNLDALAGAAGTTADAAWSGSGNATLVAALKALWTDLKGTPVLASASFTRTGAGNTTPYSAMQVVTTGGTPGAITLAGCSRASGKGGWIQTVCLDDENNAATPLQPIIFLFTAIPTSAADNAALALADSDNTKHLHAVALFETYLVNSAAGASGIRRYEARGLGIGFTIPSGTSLFAYIVSGAAYTPVSAEKFVVTLGIEQN